MAEIYGTNQYPSDIITVEAGDTFAVGAAFNTTAGLIGVGDTNNGDATAGTVYDVTSSSQARTLFGSDSELQEQIDLAFVNGATEVHAVAVPETQSTESFSSTTQFTLDNAPAFDPNLHSNKTITIQDTSEGAECTVNIVYGTVTQPSENNTVNLNPNTGEAYADASSTYEVTYEYGDYTNVIGDVVNETPRAIGVCTENTSIGNTLLTEAENAATGFNFTRGYVGAEPEVDAGNYTDSFDSRRFTVVSTSRGYLDQAETDETRTVGAIVGKQAGKPLGDSTTYEGVNGLASLRTPSGGYSDSDIVDFISEQVMPVVDDGGIQIIKDMTTSTEPKFERVYASEIVDEVTELVHTVSKSFVGERANNDGFVALEDSLEATLDELREDDLIVASSLNITEGATAYEADVDIGIQVVPIFDTIDVSITVGEVVTNNTEA